MVKNLPLLLQCFLPEKGVVATPSHINYYKIVNNNYEYTANFQHQTTRQSTEEILVY